MRKSGNFRNVKKEGRNFYQDYIQGKYINNVYFGKKGIDETLRWYPQNVKNIPELEYNFKKSVYSGKEELKHARKDDTVHFEVYKNKNNTYLVAVDKKGNKKYYIDKTTSENNTPTQSRGLSESGSNNSIANHVSDFNIASEAKRMFEEGFLRITKAEFF